MSLARNNFPLSERGESCERWAVVSTEVISQTILILQRPAIANGGARKWIDCRSWCAVVGQAE